VPVNQYSVLKGDPQSGAISKNARPHYLIEVAANGTNWQIAVNVESDVGTGSSAQVLYKLDENWTPPDAAMLTALPIGVTPLVGKDANPAIDYLRTTIDGTKDGVPGQPSQPIVTRAQLTPLPLPGQTNAGNLHNAVIAYLNQAIADKNGTIYAFGALYTTGNGIHDIHMNQGNPKSDHSGDNGIWQDGLLVFQMPAANNGAGRWVAIYIAFQEQVWQTDPTGNPTI